MHITPSNIKETSNGEWFDSLIASIRADEVQLDSGVASEEKQKMYQSFINRDTFELAKYNRQFLIRALVPNAINDFLIALDHRKPNKLAFSYTDSSLLAWVEIKEGNEEMEDLLIDAEAMINAKYYEYGFHMDSMVVEDSDNFEIPPHYKPLIG
ncbi:hypothetical protein [Roseivirga sp. UBA1976]|uniref:hypothetical protein n=1 Tax=Roseivirga sp. UBA1976 TaxID=1947386 RepID=UPI00257DF421|nr:hypothetical protein [Roseivirga sp. UBA1976]MEC7754532.1 hypothetical protein [Bacteroidota bacterium]|tara:strand:- start:19283 stop:19744 length:462 start_codon:yes stop_codon:yes gene_type:complete